VGVWVKAAMSKNTHEEASINNYECLFHNTSTTRKEEKKAVDLPAFLTKH
jgi:hypothetical protein